MQASDNERDGEVEVLSEIEISEEIYPNGKLLVIAYEYKNPNRADDKFNCLALCMKVGNIIYFASVSSTFNYENMHIRSVDVQDVDFVVIRLVNMDPCNGLVLMLKNVNFSNNPMCLKIVEEYEKYYNNGNEYVLK